MNTMYFGDLQQKVKNAETFCTQHNAYAKHLQDTTGQILPRYDLVQVLHSITKQHRKFYGATSKYDGKGNLRYQN